MAIESKSLQVKMQNANQVLRSPALEAEQHGFGQPCILELPLRVTQGSLDLLMGPGVLILVIRKIKDAFSRLTLRRLRNM